MVSSLFELPACWDVKPLSDITRDKIVYGIVQAGPHVDDGIPYIKSTDIVNGICLTQLSRTAKVIHNKYRRSAVEPGDVVISLRSNIGETAIVPDEVKLANLTQGTARIRVKGCHLAEFISYQISNPLVKRSILAVSKGSTFKEISLEDLRKIRVPFPPLSEQKKIARILSTWDKAIETVDKLIDNSQKQKHWLMQYLLTDKRKFCGFSGEDRRIKVGDIITEYKVKSTVQDQYELFTSSRSGLIRQSEYFNNNRISSRDNIGFNIIPEGYVTYRSRSDDGIFVFNKNTLGVTGIVSHFYPVFKFKNESDIFFLELFNLLAKKIGSYSVGTSQTVLSMNALRSIRLRVPQRDECYRIGVVLNHANRIIEEFITYKRCIEYQKRALMQELLTGKRRVKVEETHSPALAG